MGSVEKREAFPPGTLVGERYRIVSTLARGGFGVVYVAEQLATERRVALKLLSSHLRDLSVDRLLAEARIASRVSSEHIVQVFDAGIDPDSSLVFVAMELLLGTDLAELVQREGPQSASETAEYLRQVALGLEKVHRLVTPDGRAAPIVHRDLKPANLFLTEREDGSAWIKILDFGAAKVLSEESHVSGVVRGTPQYMAYEQAAGGEVTPATDIWALGLIAFFLLTGRSYWLGAQRESGQAQIFGEVLTQPLAAASERAKELGADVTLSPAFDAWFFRCVNRDASQRHASASDAARELAHALGVPLPPERANRSRAVSDSVERTASASASSLHTPDLSAVASSRRARHQRSRLTAAVVAILGLGGAVGAHLWARVRPSSAPTAGTQNAVPSALPAAPRLERAPPRPLEGDASSLRAPPSSPAAPSAPPPSARPRKAAPLGVPRDALRSRRATGAAIPSAAVPSSEDLYDQR